MIVDSIPTGIEYNSYIFETNNDKNGRLKVDFVPLSPSILIRVDKASTINQEEGVLSIPIPLPPILENPSNVHLETVFSPSCHFYPYPEQRERRETFPSFHLQCIRDQIPSDVLLVPLNRSFKCRHT